MKTYHIYRIEPNGEPKKKQTTHAHTIDSAWDSNKRWYSDGRYLISSADGLDAKIFILPQNEPPAAPQETEENPPTLCVCERCLMAIESREGQQITRKIYLDEDDPRPCDWCEDTENDVLYEIL